MAMRTSLQKAFEAAARLPKHEQDRLAAAILHEIEDEKSWDETLSSSIDFLEKLADEALEERRAGKTEPLNPDNL
jgi:hypothetical protein